MTTEVKILNSQYRVEVVTIDEGQEGTERRVTSIVEPHTELSFFVFGDRKLVVRELPKAEEAT